MREKRELKNNNLGFSLVEVLISIAIIAVILLPALAAFSTYNASALGLKDIQRGTTLAQNVMEVAKTGEFNDYKRSVVIEKSLAGYSIGSAYESSPGNYGDALTADSTTASGDALASCYIDENGKTQYRSRNDGKYSYVYTNVKDGSNKYDVVVNMTSSGYRNAEKTGYNDTSLGDIAGLDSKRAAVITTTTDISEQAAEFFVEPTYYSSTNIVNENMLMKMDIYISGDIRSSNDKVRISAIPTYYLKGDDENTWSPGYVYQKDFSATSAEHLEKIYILYSQSYSSRANTSDSIEFHFDGNYGLYTPKIYLVKQSQTISRSGNLDIYSDDNDQFAEGGFLSDIRGNISVTNLNGSRYVSYMGSPKFKDQNNYTSTYGVGSANYKYVDSDNIMTDEDADSGEENLADNRIYDVTVTVYTAGSNFSDKVVSMTSTRRE